MQRLIDRKLFHAAVLALGIFMLCAPANAATLFHDDFESGDLSTENANFRWGPARAHAEDSVAVKSNLARSGNHAIEFKANGDGTTTKDGPASDAWIELRYHLPTPRKEVWFRWYQYFPTGEEGLGTAEYRHRNDHNPSNNKFFLIGNTDAYETGTDDLFDMEIGPGDGLSYAGKNGYSEKGASYILPKHTNGRYTSRFEQQGINGGVVQDRALRGKWIPIVMHFRLASSLGAADAVAEVWVNGTKIVNQQGINVWPDDDGMDDRNVPLSKLNIITGGYMMGWQNSGFEKTTKTWIDDFTMSDTSLAPNPRPGAPTDVFVDDGS